jgi:NTP pyrophosphatase (non-canonical NTP hydrolase)
MREMNDNRTTIEEIKLTIKEFIDERDWDQFHNPKDVAIGIVTEAGELLDHFRFKTNEEITEMLKNAKKKEEIEDELADVMFFCADFARVAGIDISNALKRKMDKSEKKYPKDKVKGKNHKYTYYQSEAG